MRLRFGQGQLGLLVINSLVHGSGCSRYIGVAVRPVPLETSRSMMHARVRNNLFNAMLSYLQDAELGSAAAVPQLRAPTSLAALTKWGLVRLRCGETPAGHCCS